MFFINSKSCSAMLIACAAGVPLFLPFHSYANGAIEEVSRETVWVPELEITAARRVISTLDIPYTVEVIDRQQLEDKLVRSLPEALTEAPGVLVQKTANGHGSPFIRGFTGYRTLALIDGVRYNNSVYRDGPNEYFSLIDFSTLDRLELLSGPSSTLYGSDAIGGALNLKTKQSGYETAGKGEQLFSGSQHNRYSSAENSHISRTEIEVGVGQKWGLLLGYTAKGFGDVEAAELGTLPHTGYDETGVDVRFDATLNENWGITLVHQQLTQDDVWRTHSTIFSKPFAGTTIGTDLQRLKDQKRSLDYLKLTGSNLNGVIDRAQLTLSHQSWDENGRRVKGSGAAIEDFFDSRMSGIDLQLESQTEHIDWVYGFDYYQDRVNSGRVDYLAGGAVDQVRIQGPIGDDSQYDLAGVYLQGEFFVNERLSIMAGSRYTYTKANVGRFEDPVTNLSASFADDWGNLSHSLRLSYALDERQTTKLWGGVSQSFRAPNIADLSRFGKSRSTETEVAATGLQPEEFLTYEIGLKKQFRRTKLSATYYYTEISDFIASTPTGRIVGGLVEVSKRNSSDGYIQGIELNGEFALNDAFDLYANATWLEGRLEVFDSTVSSSAIEQAYSRIMPLTTNLGVNWTSLSGQYWATLAVTHARKADKLSSGDEGDSERIPPGGTPAYTLVNLRGGVEVNPAVSITLGLENLLDEAYRSHGSGSNEPGFGVNAGIRVRF